MTNDDTPPPTLSDEDLIQLAREGAAQPAAQQAPGWESPVGRARVGLWRSGKMLARAEAASADVELAIRGAASAALASVPGEVPPDDEHNATVLDVEVMMDIQPIRPEGLSGLLFALEPGIHGLVLKDGDRTVGGWPADALRGGRSSARWTKSLLRQVRPPGARLPPSTGVARFRTRQVVGMLRPPTDRPVRAVAMQGATRVVPPQSVNRQDLGRAAGRAGSWLARHQHPNGLFQYGFLERDHTWSKTTRWSARPAAPGPWRGSPAWPPTKPSSPPPPARSRGWSRHR